MEDRIVLKYDGGTAGNGEMDAYAVADAIRGFSDFTRRLGEGLYGRETQVRTAVRALRSGSFEIEVLYRISEAAGILVSSLGAFASPEDILTLI